MLARKSIVAVSQVAGSRRALRPEEDEEGLFLCVVVVEDGCSSSLSAGFRLSFAALEALFKGALSRCPKLGW